MLIGLSITYMRIYFMPNAELINKSYEYILVGKSVGSYNWF